MHTANIAEEVVNELFPEGGKDIVNSDEVEMDLAPSHQKCLASSSPQFTTTIQFTDLVHRDNVHKTLSSLGELVEFGRNTTDQKKNNHNLAERRRRNGIDEAIHELSILLPKEGEKYYDFFRNLRRNKASVLRAAVEYIVKLKEEAYEKVLQGEIIKLRESTNHELARRIQKYEQHMNTHGIPFDHLVDS